MLREVESVNMGCTLALKQQFQEICNVNAGIAEKSLRPPVLHRFHTMGRCQCCQIFSEKLSYKRPKIIVFGPKLSYLEFFTIFLTNFTKLTWQKKWFVLFKLSFFKIYDRFSLFQALNYRTILSYYRTFGNTELLQSSARAQSVDYGGLKASRITADSQNFYRKPP